jgi:hypothetical protein
MKYAAEMGSGANIGSSIQKLIRGIHRQHGNRISLLSFFQNKESMLIIVQLAKKLSAFYGARKSITVITRTRH